MLWVIGTKRYTYNFVINFMEYRLKIQTCHTILWWAMKHIFICMTVNKLNFSTLPPFWPKVTVWCAVWSRGVIGPYFFEAEDRQSITVISQCYTEMINAFLAPKLPPNHNLWFQQNSVRPTQQWLAWLRLTVCFHSGWFLVLVTCHGLLVHWT